MASNAKNVAELLNTDTTVKVADIEDGSITTAKIAADAVTTAKIANSAVTNVKTAGVGAGGKNIIVNGEMMVAQRGTSFASVGNVYTLDRFEFYKQNSGAAFTVTQSTVTDLAGFGHALKVDCTTADTSLASNEQGYISTKIEGRELQRFAKGHGSDALPMTLSFYVKTNKTGVYTVSIFDRDNTRKVNGSYTVSNANWNRYTITFPADASGKLDNDINSSLELFFNLYAGADTNTGTLYTTWQAAADAGSTTGQVNFADNTSNDWEITGIQLETGSTATPFEHSLFGEELLLCKRYFEVYSPTSADEGAIAVVRTRTNVNGYNAIVNYHEKRAQPSCAIDYDRMHKPGVVKDTLSAITITISTGETQSCQVNATPSNDSSISTHGYLGKSSGTGSLKLDAEL